MSCVEELCRSWDTQMTKLVKWRGDPRAFTPAPALALSHIGNDSQLVDAMRPSGFIARGKIVWLEEELDTTGTGPKETGKYRTFHRIPIILQGGQKNDPEFSEEKA
ncbi:hypothetical protein Ddc_08731 [Ditylenchus destructor]|nr:hypothetical protein Ddc_08731 [Ditylenchus destructor]